MNVISQHDAAHSGRVVRDSAIHDLRVDLAHLGLLPPKSSLLHHGAVMHVHGQRSHKKKKRLHRPRLATVRQHLVQLLLHAAGVEARAARGPRGVQAGEGRDDVAVADEVDRESGVRDRADDLRHAHEHAASSAAFGVVVQFEKGHDDIPLVPLPRRCVEHGGAADDARGKGRSCQIQRESSRLVRVRHRSVAVADASQQLFEASHGVAEAVHGALELLLDCPKLEMLLRGHVRGLGKLVAQLAPALGGPPPSAEPAVDAVQVCGQLVEGGAGTVEYLGKDVVQFETVRPEELVADVLVVEHLRLHDRTPLAALDQARSRLEPERDARQDLALRRSSTLLRIRNAPRHGMPKHDDHPRRSQSAARKRCEHFAASLDILRQSPGHANDPVQTRTREQLLGQVPVGDGGALFPIAQDHDHFVRARERHTRDDDHAAEAALCGGRGRRQSGDRPRGVRRAVRRMARRVARRPGRRVVRRLRRRRGADVRRLRNGALRIKARRDDGRDVPCRRLLRVLERFSQRRRRRRARLHVAPRK
mmetsp:Transcript_33435/g.117143  ORF Transcript_33435/g.117143 Transcript_33435/m.117143 type:complete len:534 (+) Transcript_33435:2405-4006(+)